MSADGQGSGTPVAGIAGEFLCSGKNPRHLERCEDRAVLALPWAAAVIDGATDITGDVYEGRAGGWLAADALARFLYRAAVSGELASWDDQTLVREANASLMALYCRLGIVASTDADAGRRFRAGMAVARATKEGLRLTSVALPGVRIDGRHCPMESAEPAHAFENLLAATRGALWHDPDLARLSPEKREEACRSMLIGGRGTAGAFAAAWARAEAAVRARVQGPAAQIEAAFATGLLGNRRSRSTADPLFGPAIDGYCGTQPPLWSGLLPWGQFHTVELFSDGYVVPPAEVSIAAWEAHVRHMNEIDPHRVGPFPAVKGAVPGGHHDDRTVVILRDWRFRV
jgi:hypothetical protein